MGQVGDDDVGLHAAEGIAQGIAEAGHAVDLALDELGMAEELVEAVPKPRGAVDGGLEGVAQEVVETAIARVEEVEDFGARAVGGKVLDGGMDVPCGDVFPLAEPGCKYKNFLQSGGGLNYRYPL